MIPIRLSFEGFGPYVERQEIDFTRFLQTGLLLIRGETGAGKTVLLDAMTYALYGRSSGGGRGEFSEMRSLLAPPGTPTRVEFEFDVRGRRYRFTRGLRVRRKRTGAYEYLTEQDAYYLDQEGVFVTFFENPRQRDVEAKARELIGLNCEQFCQVMILPQGRFERLLISKSEEKEEVLVSLFHAERWQKIADSVCARANRFRQELEQEKAALQAILDGQGCTDAQALAEKAAQAKTRLAEQTARREAAAATLSLKRRVFEEESRLAALFEKRETVRAEQRRLEARLPEDREKQRRIASARRAAQAQGACAQAGKAFSERERREQEFAQAEQRRVQALRSLQAAQDARATLEREGPAYQADRAALARLETLRESYRMLKEAESANQEAQKNWERSERAVQDRRVQAQSCARRKDMLEAERQRIFTEYSTRLPELREAVRELRRIVEQQERLGEARQQAEGWEAKLVRLRAEREEARSACERARENREILGQRYLRNAAAALAAGLLEGQPCPVCGGSHHPAPAGPSEDAVTDAQIAEADREAAKMQRAYTACETRLAQAEAGRQSAAQLCAELEAGLELPGEGLREQLALAERRLQKAEEQDARAGQTAVQLHQAAEAEKQAQEALQREEKRLEQAAAERQRAQARYETLAAQRDPQIPDQAALEHARQSAEKRCAAYESALHCAQENESAAKRAAGAAEAASAYAQAELERCRVEAERAQAALREALAQAGFQTPEQVAAAVLPETAVLAWEQELADARVRREASARQYEELDGQIAGREKPDLEAPGRELAALEAQKASLDAGWGALRQQAEQMEKSARTYQTRRQALDLRRDECDRMTAFGRLLRGDSGVSLRRYLLGVMLSSVTAEANRLLRSVHGGRYQLFRTSEASGRVKKAGLDLEVFDAHAGGRRGVSSLSGGEKFLVSLSLALGLSAVVQAQSGGVRMDAMFIDEGFGSLDPQSIADALGVLASVRGSRRLVGIISHVEALRENIEASIEVVKNRTGSRLKIHL